MKRLPLLIILILVPLLLQGASVGKINGVTEASCGKVNGLGWQTGTQTLGKVNGLTADYDTNLCTTSDSASSATNYGAFVAGMAADGNGSTFYQSYFQIYPLPGTAQWWKYDFGSGSAKAINKIIITALYTVANHYGQPNDYKIQGSNNDSDWTDVYTGNGSDVSVLTITFSNSTAYRYWRIYVTSAIDTAYGDITWYTVDMRITQ